jgi:hypothetical protein
MNIFKKLQTSLGLKESRTMSGATRAYKQALTSSWKEGGKSGKLIHKAAEMEKSKESPISLIHAKTMRKTAKKLRKQSSQKLDTALRLRPLVPQTRKRNP